MTMYIVSYVDYGDTVDGYARLSDVLPDERAAEAFIEGDLKLYRKHFGKKKIKITHESDRRVCAKVNGDVVCQWSIHAIEIPVKFKIEKPTKEKHNVKIL